MGRNQTDTRARAWLQGLAKRVQFAHFAITGFSCLIRSYNLSSEISPELAPSYEEHIEKLGFLKRLLTEDVVEPFETFSSPELDEVVALRDELQEKITLEISKDDASSRSDWVREMQVWIGSPTSPDKGSFSNRIDEKLSDLAASLE